MFRCNPFSVQLECLVLSDHESPHYCLAVDVVGPTTSMRAHAHFDGQMKLIAAHILAVYHASNEKSGYDSYTLRILLSVSSTTLMLTEILMTSISAKGANHVRNAQQRIESASPHLERAIP